MKVGTIATLALAAVTTASPVLISSQPEEGKPAWVCGWQLMELDADKYSSRMMAAATVASLDPEMYPGMPVMAASIAHAMFTWTITDELYLSHWCGQEHAICQETPSHLGLMCQPIEA